MNKCKILVPQGCRSDIPLSDPVIKRLKEDDSFEVIVLKLNPHSFGDSYFKTKSLCLHFKPDLLYATGDRIEMTAAACAAFHSNVPVIHYGAGVLNKVQATWDDRNRHCITLWSDFWLCEDEDSAEVTIRFLRELGIREAFNVEVVGHTHCDDIEVDESLVPQNGYTLILYNPTTMYEEEVPQILKEVDGGLVWIGSNPDPTIQKFPIDHENLPRAQFLGLMKNCKRFISNSSCVYYEAPMFLKPEQIIIIGDRNKKRSSKFNGKPGASEKIVKIIKNKWLSKCLKEK